MSRQRSGTSSSSSRGSQSSGGSTRGTSNRTTTQDQEFAGATGATSGAAQTGGSFSSTDAQRTGTGGQGTMEKAQQLAGQVQQKATQRVESGLAKGKTQAAQTLRTVADSLLNTGQQLRERDQEPVSRYVDQFADRVQRVSNYLQSTDVNEIVDRTEDFARRRPALFLGGAFALGLLGARFLKSSRRQVEGRGQFSSKGGGTGQRRMREGITGIEQEVPTGRSQQEWAAGGARPTGLADVSVTSASTQGDLLGDGPDFGRERRPVDFATPPGGPEASQR